ncbi:TauD/TfdA family dioxygenase [Pseudomonas sp. N040]|uniref:TauD/TfdA family dioxygenase n=1 Tax=Pseudomonas sp. N040 TaxID=2785325 RepID=UPI0018A27AFB|nr:TauD/TfdA family dioxygenase [Pseudomonas sp. N040]MBF7731569.1 TauD/TfdA family dioxygenase [Pseudomonas sp. N040]MBW7015213.1 TauD/TfdA family dioxygenase [Pseudomonas sp. N040]
MSNAALSKIDHPAAWTVKSLMAQQDKWIYQFTAQDIAELDAALQQVKARGLIVPKFGKDDFPMPKLAAKLKGFLQSLSTGMGIFYLKGFPVERFSKDDASAIFWGIGTYIGRPWQQNARGHVLGDVINEGRDPVKDMNARGYQSTAELDLHTDGADIVGLLCLKQAPEGGENQLCSAVSVFNKVIEDNPAAAQHLLETEYCFDWRGEQQPGEKPYYRSKLVTRQEDGSVAFFCITEYVRSAQRFEEVPRLSGEDLAAFDAYNKAKWDESLVLRLRQVPGDMLFLNNHFMMHARSEFKDAEDPRERRHLRRLWLETDDWHGKRPAAMNTLLVNARNYWEKNDVGVQMWDHK